MSAKKIFTYCAVLFLAAIISGIAIFMGVQWARVPAIMAVFGGAIAVVVGFIAMCSGDLKE